MKLNDLKIGRSGIITNVKGDGAFRRRLLDMGLTPKTKIYVRKVAPLGDPIEINLRGYELTLRSDDAANILITPTDIETAEEITDACDINHCTSCHRHAGHKKQRHHGHFGSNS